MDSISAIHNACINGNYDEVEKMINEGANVNAKTDEDITPLHYAVILDNIPLAELLLNNGAIIQDDLIEKSFDTHYVKSDKANTDHYEIIEMLIQRGCPVQSSDGEIIHATSCVFSGYNRTLELLLNNGLDTSRDCGFSMPSLLYAACTYKNKEAVVRILNSGYIPSDEEQDMVKELLVPETLDVHKE